MLANSGRFWMCHSQIFNKLVIVRHGESIWNKEKKWAGWTDVPLSSNGIKEAKHCAEHIKREGLRFDEIYTSVLNRAIKTTNYILDEIDMHYLPVYKHWRLNEKHYGALQGEKKVDVNERYGEELVTEWRRSMDQPPPPLDIHDSRHPSKDKKYKYINQDFLPRSESLSDIIGRLRPLWDAQIKKKLLDNKKLLIVAHGSSLRALISLLQPDLSERDVQNFNIPSAVPIICELNDKLLVTKVDYLGEQSEIEASMNRIINQIQKTVDI